MLTVSSTAWPRRAFDAIACTSTISPASMRRLSTSWTHVDQDRPRARLAPPRRLSEVARRLVEQRTALHRHQPAQFARCDHVARGRHHRAVAAVVADQHRHARALDRIDEPPGLLQRVGDRLLDQHRNATCEARERGRHVQRVRRREDHAVGPERIERSVEIAPERHLQVRGVHRAGRRRIGDAGQLEFIAAAHAFGMDAPDAARTRQQQAQPGIHGGALPRRSRMRPGSGTERCSTSSPSHTAERRARSATTGSGICW